MARFYNPVDAGDIGQPGPTGPPGPQGEQGIQGQIGFPGFKYDARRAFENQYVAGEIIEYGGDYFICLANNDAIPPTGGAIGIYWNPYSFIGPQGEQGIQGIQGETGPVGGFGYYGSFYDELDQTGTLDSIQAMRMRTTDLSNGISVGGTNSTQIIMAHAGKYNIAFSAQMHQTNSSSIINIWLAKNGTAMSWTNTKCAITANNPYYVAAWNFFVDANINDYYEIMWSANSASTILESEPAVGSGATLHPAVPSVIVTVNQVG